MASIADTVTALVKETVEQQGVSLWDVRFVKEGADYFLRIFIDKAEGVSIDDCVNVSRAIDPIIDEADPIEQSYCLEVCSAGMERELTKPEHFEAMIGKTVALKLYKAQDGVKEFTGVLEDFDGGVTLGLESETKYFNKTDIAKVKLADF